MNLSPSPQVRPNAAIDPLLRFFDIVISAVSIIFLVIPLLLIAVIIFAEDRKSPFFYQMRVGRKRSEFRIIKFRTMFVDPERFSGAQTKLETQSLQESRAQFQTTVPNDPRITHVGRILRPLHLDELPQIWNIFVGHMSFVGVRPDVPVQASDYSEQEWVDRHVTRPGITGLAQVSSDIDGLAKRTAYDMQWLERRSFSLYVRILWLTAGKVVKRNSL